MANLSSAADDDFELDDEEQQLLAAMEGMTEEEFAEYLDSLPPSGIQALVGETAKFDKSIPDSPLAQAMQLDPAFVSRPHLEYLSDRIKSGLKRVEQGEQVRIMVSMPPRSGKSSMISENLPIWILRKHPDWFLALLSWSPELAIKWSRRVREVIAQRGLELGVQLNPGARAEGDWETTAGGEVHARSYGVGLTGQGAHVMIIDDPIRDSLVAHSANYRQMIWDRWTANLQTRLQPGPNMVIVVMTRWHEDDLSGRLVNPEIEGSSPGDWEVISFPAIAEENDVLGRAKGDPLYPPLLPMIRDKALEWWTRLKNSMSSYDFEAQYQQRPSAAQGTIFNIDWWRYWTRDPAKVTYFLDANGEPTSVPDGYVVLLPDSVANGRARTIDSWDLNFDDTVNSDFVVGQRWAMLGETRYLLDQIRGRWDFPETLHRFEEWNADGVVAEHVVEKKANGAAMIKMLMQKFTGFHAESPTTSKENRARAITWEIEHGHVRLPLPEDAPWMQRDKFMDELREFPTGAHDDQVDVLTQALSYLKGDGIGGVSDPNKVMAQRAQLAASGQLPVRSPITAGRSINRGYGGRIRT